MTPLFLSRARLRTGQSTAALASVLFPGAGLAPHAGKALVWSLFADTAERRRDFLWRWDGGRPGRLAGEFLILSARPPVDAHNLFALESKAFAPALRPGDRLGFRLRANPVVRAPVAGHARSPKHDVVMHGLRAHPPGSRAAARDSLIEAQGRAWLERQLGKAGAALVPGALRVDGYQEHRVPKDGAEAIRFSTLDLDGLLAVEQPERFAAALAAGFGSSKAYGCGLMLIRPA